MACATTPQGTAEDRYFNVRVSNKYHLVNRFVVYQLDSEAHRYYFEGLQEFHLPSTAPRSEGSPESGKSSRNAKTPPIT